uniref:Adenylate kinase n=1 Tax=Panagrolaimus sp. JU765 TaxID=591449 RepID=A0AC34R5R0_9BILA
FFSGGPGSGKGTQCDLIVKKYGLTHLSSGDLLRAEVQGKTEIGLKCKAIMDQGGLVPLEVILDLVKKAMVEAAKKGTKGFLIDGYPREVKQGDQFEAEIQEAAVVIYFECTEATLTELKQGDQFEAEIQEAAVVIYFECTEATLTERLLGRGKSSGRSDDNAETIKNRLATFLKSTQPVVEHYNKKGKLAKINAERGVEPIFADVCAVLDKHTKK